MLATEDQIHRAIVCFLKTMALSGVIWWHTPNGGMRNKTEAARFHGLGVKAGVPDILLLSDGQLFALELKRIGGRLSPSQRQMLDALANAGARIHVAYGVDQAFEILREWRLVRQMREAA